MRADEKITADEILDAICEDIKFKLRRNDAFGNNSLCYSGAAYKLDIAVTLRSRAETAMDQVFVSSVGEIEDAPITAVATAHVEGVRRRGRPKKEVQLLDTAKVEVLE